MKYHILPFLLSLSLAGCQLSSQTTPALNADQIYFGGDILTMESEEPQYVQAIAVKDGNILELGSLSTIKALAGDNTEMIEATVLGGKTSAL